MSQRKLLLADDSITIQKVVNLTFADEGIEVVTVSDGDAAMEKLLEFKPDLILADVNMPGLNGYQICEKVKQNSEWENTPVILLVGSFEPFDEAEAQRVGADDFLTKPFQSIRQLVSKVNELLDSSQETKSSAENETTENVFSASPEYSSESEVAGTKFNDSGLDDEMIQTNQPTGFGLDEVAKFETKEAFEATEDFAKTQPFSAEEIQEYAYAAPDTAASLAEVEDAALETDQLEVQEAKSAAEETQADETKFEESETGNASNEQIPVEVRSDKNEPEKTTNESSNPEMSLDFDDDFLLELPPEEDEAEEETAESESESSTEAAEDQSDELQSEINQPEESPAEENHDLPAMPDSAANHGAHDLAETQGIPANYSVGEVAAFTPSSESFETVSADEQNQPAVATFVASSQLSSETIDIIVQKVIEKMSDKAVREIAWEVVPQLADLIVKKMVEEKLKQ